MILKSVLSVIMMNMKYWPVIRLINLLSATWPGKIKFPLSKIPLSIVDYGNTGCASIPLAICEHYSNKNTSQDSGKILTCGFGIGLSLGIVGITVEPQNCFPVFRVKERYDDGLSFEDYK